MIQLGERAARAERDARRFEQRVHSALAAAIARAAAMYFGKASRDPPGEEAAYYFRLGRRTIRHARRVDARPQRAEPIPPKEAVYA